MIMPKNAPKKAICLAPKLNSPQRMDATGAFLPYMEAFRRLYWPLARVTTLPFDNTASAAARFAAITAAFHQASGKLDTVVYLGHGEPYGLVSAHIYFEELRKFAELIKATCVHGVRVLLYACSSGKVDYPGGSFAARLAQALDDIGGVVFGHDNVGHTCTNANLYRYSGFARARLVAPPGKFAAFDRLLKAECLDKKPKSTEFWARTPFMTSEEIGAEVG
jgi:hypothetical protein